jgi:HEAT repeats
MTRLLTHTDSRVRSKAALLVGRSNKNHKWVQDKLGEPDARVRATAVESLWGSDSAGSRAVFLTALGDADNRVVGNALLALYRLGDPTCVRLILEMLTHSDAGFRVSAVWVMGETGDQRFIPTLARLISEPLTELRGNAFRALAKIKKTMSARSDTEHLDIFLGHPQRERENWVQFTAAVRCRRETQIPDLNGTNFAMWEDSVLVREYSIRQRGKHEPVAVAVGMPRILDRRSPSQQVQERAVEQALRYKRGQDIWTVLKYVTASQEASGLADAGGLIPDDEDLSSLRMRFTADDDKIENAVAIPGSRMACGSDLHQAMRSLIDATAHMRAARNIVLICQSPLDTFKRDIEVETEAAHMASIAVHIITPWPTNSMREMCSRTGGTLVTPTSPSGIPEALEGLCASLLHSYDVRFQLENPSASKLRLQIYSGAFTGETVQSLF